MDAKIRNWLSRKESQRNIIDQLKTQPYGSTVPLPAPYIGTFPVRGNGPISIENLLAKFHARTRRQPTEVIAAAAAAAPPDVPRTRRYSETDRPFSGRSGHRSVGFRSYGRRRSAGSLD